jgi:hypothetical protein
LAIGYWLLVGRFRDLGFVIHPKVCFANGVNPTRVIFWNEYIHEKKDPAVAAVYPAGIHAQLAAAFSHDPQLACETATLEEKEHGLPVDRMENTDVLVWWGHLAHKQVEDEFGFANPATRLRAIFRLTLRSRTKKCIRSRLVSQIPTN